MPKLLNVAPKYRHHKASGQAVVTLKSVDHYFGPWKSKASKVDYDRLIGEWLANGRSLPASVNELTIAELGLSRTFFGKLLQGVGVDRISRTYFARNSGYSNVPSVMVCERRLL